MYTIANARLNETPSKLIKIAAIIGIVWYAFGLLQFWLAYSLDTSAAVSAGEITTAHGAALSGTPALIWLSFAVASLAGLIGSILLALGLATAVMSYGISLIAAVIYYAWVYGLSGTGADRPQEEIYIAIVVVAVTAAFFFISKRAAKQRQRP